MLERIPPPSGEVIRHAQRERFFEDIENVYSGGVLGCRWGSVLFAGAEMAVELRRRGFGDALDLTGILWTRQVYAHEFGESLQALWVVNITELGLGGE
jgi:hypothetical protein